MTHENQVALAILSERAVESARRGAGRRAVASPHRCDACPRLSSGGNGGIACRQRRTTPRVPRPLPFVRIATVQMV